MTRPAESPITDRELLIRALAMHAALCWDAPGLRLAERAQIAPACQRLIEAFTQSGSPEGDAAFQHLIAALDRTPACDSSHTQHQPESAQE